MPFILAVLLLIQSALGAAGWHLDDTPKHHTSHEDHCAVVVQHSDDGLHASEQNHQDEHHHYCHTTIGNLALPVVFQPLNPIEPTVILTIYTPASYLNPSIKFLIRPPIT